MTKINYTVEQEQAIKTRGENLLISAAAGAGKTQVLIERIVGLVVHDEVPLSKMLVVTFTNAAASEMKSRLQVGLGKAMEDYPEKSSFLIQQIRDLPLAHVSTLHAYCIYVLRNFYHVIGLEPNFRVMNDATRIVLQEKALTETFDAYYAQGEEGIFFDLIEAYGGKNSDEGVRRMVHNLAHFLRTMPDQEAWLSMALAPYDDSSDGELDDSDPYVALLFDEIKEELKEAEAILSLCDQILPLDGSLAVYRDAFVDDDAILQSWKDVVKRGKTIEDLVSLSVKPSYVRLKSVPKKTLTASELKLADEYKNLRDRYKKKMSNVADAFPKGGSLKVKADRQKIRPYLYQLVDLAQYYLKRYQEAKEKRNEVDYNDLEVFMLDILANQEASQSIKEQIEYVFFDEYQDCNGIQEKIISALAPDRGLFYVGDVKQAIYRFRFADPTLFNQRYRNYLAGNGGKVIHLADNFRSLAPVLTFANHLFEDLMTPQLGDVDYKAPGQALVPHRTSDEEETLVELVILDKKNSESSSEDAQAVWIAHHIKDLVENKGYTYGDIAILLRSPRRTLAYFEGVFKNLNIPYYSDNTTVDFDNTEVQLFLNALQVIHNDLQDQPLIAVLISPFAGLTDQDLASIRLAYPQGSFAEACGDYSKDYHDDCAAKLKNFYNRLEAIRFQLKCQPLVDVAERLLHESGYSAFLLALEDGQSRLANVQAFIDRIADYEADSDSGLSGFLMYAKALKQRKGDNLSPGIALSAEDNHVQIMSIHKSKGLGFPVVYVADLNKGFNFQDVRTPFVLHKDLGLSLSVVDLEQNTVHTPFEKKRFAHVIGQETRAEEVRLLYVALTRAKERLILVSEDKDLSKSLESSKQKVIPYSLYKERSVHDWLLSLFSQEGNPLAFGQSKDYLYHAIDVEEMLSAYDEEEKEESLHFEGGLDPEYEKRVGEVFAFHYPYQDMTTKAYKTTVTDLSKADQDNWQNHIQVLMKKPSFLEEEISLTAAEKGTLLHKVMQWLPLKPMSDEDIRIFLDDLVVQGFVSLFERKALKEMHFIQDFLQSTLGRAICQVAETVEREVSFTMCVADTIVDGQIDLIFCNEKGWQIVDFKSDRTRDDAKYQKQLSLYKEALEKARGIRVSKVHLYWLRHGESSSYEL